MIDEASIEFLKDNIISKNTSEYFEEVYSCYVHRNYRSAVVMLWSVVVLDVVEKLEILDSLYGDTKAKEILKIIKSRKEANRKSSIWELEIVEKVSNETDLIDITDFVNLKQIQEQRHLSAHPIIKDDISLYSPNKDTTRAMIRSALEVLLTKPPMYAKKIVDNITNDLAKNRGVFENDPQTLKSYVEEKFLKKMSIKTKTKVYRSFWKLVMQLDNEDTSRYRNVTYAFLKVLADSCKAEIIDTMERDPNYYSKVDEDYKLIPTLIEFLSEVPELYKTLNNDIKTLIDSRIASDSDLKPISYFKHSTLQEHYAYLKVEFEHNNGSKNIPYERWERLKNRSDSLEMESEFVKFLGRYYSNCGTFDRANVTCNVIINLLGQLEIENIIYILELADDNDQTYGRSGAGRDYRIIRAHIIERAPEFDFEHIPNFNSRSK